jgi:hypothetical protein
MTALGVLFVGVLLSSCQIVLSPVGGSSSAACPVGKWALGSETINAIVTKLGSTLASNLQVTLSGTGVTVSINADNTWILTANQSGSFTGTVAGSLPVSGTGTITASASGKYTKSATALNFTVTSLSGTLDVNASVAGGAPQHLSFPLSKTNAEDNETEIDDVVGLNGSANYSCGTNGTLTLTFTKTHVDMHLHH